MEENNLKTKKDLKKNISKNKEFEFIIKGQIPIKKIISKSNKNSTNNSSSRTNSKSNPRNSIILTKIKNENNNLNKIEFCKDKELFSDNSLSNEDLLIVIGCNNNNNNNKKELKKSLSSPYLKYGRIIKSKNFNNNKYNDKNFSKSKNEENDIMKEKVIYKPLKVAGTIYKNLCQKKMFFINKIKEKQKILKGEKKELPKIKNQILNKSNIILKKSHSITNFLNQKFIEKIPITFPLNLSYKNNYENQSEKNRQEKIIDKFIQLKTYIKSQPENENMIIKEFLIKNGFEDLKYFSPDKINNLSYFLNHPFNFDSKKRIKEIINEALNYKPTNEELISDQNKLKEVNYFLNGENKKIEIHNYSSQYYNKIKRLPKNLYNKKKNFFESINQEKLYENLSKNQQSNQSLKEIISSLEEEFKQLNNEKELINKKTNNIINKENPINKQINDKNKLVPNLCLSYKVFSKLNMNKIKKNNKKLNNLKNIEEKIKEINDRLYYNFQNSNNSFDIEKIKRRHKLTEYIILKRAKYKALIDSKKEQLGIIPFME